MADNNTTVTAGTIERRTEIFEDAQSLYTYWTNALDVAEKQEKRWTETADTATKIYRGDTLVKTSFNILHSNVETIVPALYNSTPEPDIRTKHQDADETARKAGELLERGIRVQRDEYDFDAMMIATCRDNEIAGRGVARVNYKPYIRTDEEIGETVVWEEASCEHIPWRSFRRGPGTSWRDVPWVAFEKFYSRDELIDIAGEELGSEVPLDAQDAIEKQDGKTEREQSAFRKARGWEIWDRDTRKVIILCPGFGRGVLKVEDDPLGLSDFFPVPMPLQSSSDPDTLVPIAPYEVYRKQAEELNDISERILKLIGVCKFRGIRASEIPELDGLENLEDGEFAPSEGAMALLSGAKGLDDSIWVVPVEKLIVVLRELVMQREGIKATIHEITGIADIMRGASNANETLGAQQIKTQWGSLRIQQRQRDVQRFCRDLFRMKAEIIGNKFSPMTLNLIASEQVSPEVVHVLRSDIRRAYSIDIETDSTIRGDLVRWQENMTQFLAGSAQFFGSFVPLIQSGTLPPAIAKIAIVVYAAFARQFKLGKDVEGELATLSENSDEVAGALQPQQREDPNAQAMQAQQQAQQAAEQAKMQLEQQKLGQDGQFRAAQMQLDREDKQARLELEREKSAAEREHRQALLQIEMQKAQQMASTSDRDFRLRTAAQNKALIDEAEPTDGAGMPETGAPVLQTMLQAIAGLANLAQGQQALVEQIAQGQAQQADELRMLAETLAAPKRVIRDRTGKATGVETVGTIQ